MRKKELSKYYWLCLEADLYKRHMEELRAQSTRVTKELSAMPGSPACVDKLGSVVSKIVELEQLIQHNLDNCLAEKDKLLRYIYTIDDGELRIIFSMRYVDGESWSKIGSALHCDRTTVWRKHNAFLKLAHNAHSSCAIL